MHSQRRTRMKSETKENCPPRNAKRSKIPLTKSTTGKKFKTRPAPDFQQLHRKWQHDLEMGKACYKKPCTSTNEFNLTKPGTKFERPKVQTDLDDACETHFVADQVALQSIVSDKGLSRGILTGRATTGTVGTRRRLAFRHLDGAGSPLGNQRKVLGELSPNPKCVKRSGLTLVDKQKQSDIPFERDDRALSSILNHTGISTDTPTSDQSTYQQTYAGDSGAPLANIRTSIYYIPPKVQPSSTHEAYRAYKNLFLSKLDINKIHEDKVQPQERGEFKEQGDENEKKHLSSTSTLQSSLKASPCKRPRVGSFQTLSDKSSRPIPVIQHASPSSLEDAKKSAKTMFSSSQLRKDQVNSSRVCCERSSFALSSPFGQGPVLIPHRNSIYATYKCQPSFLSSPLVTDSVRKSTVASDSARKSTVASDSARKSTVASDSVRKSTVASDSVRKSTVASDSGKMGLHTYSEISNSEGASSKLAENEVQASEHGGGKHARDTKPSVFGQSPIGQGPIVVPQKKSIYATYQSPMFKSPAVCHSVRRFENKASDTLTPTFKRFPCKSPVSYGPQRVLSSMKREKKTLTWADVLQSSRPDISDNTSTLTSQGKLVTTLLFPSEHEEVESEPVPTVGGGFSIDGPVYSATDATRHNQRDESSTGQDEVSHRCLPVALVSSSTGSPLPDLPLVTASGNGTHCVQEWTSQTELGAGRGHTTAQHASLDDYSSRLQKLEIQERLLEEVIKVNTMAMQTTDSSNEQSSSSQKTEKSQRSAVVNETRCSDTKHSASQRKTSVDELNESITESKSQIVQLEKEMEILQQAPVHDGNGNQSDSEEILRQLDIVRKQQQQLLQVQLQLQKQLQTQMVDTQDTTSSSIDKNSNVCLAKTEVREHNNNNVHSASCDNPIVQSENIHHVDKNLQMQLSKMTDFKFPGADNDPIHRAGLEEMGSYYMQSDPMKSSSAGQIYSNLDTAENIFNTEYSGMGLQHAQESPCSFKHLDLNTGRQLSAAQYSSFTPVKTEDNSDFELKPYRVSEPFAKNLTSFDKREHCFSLATPIPKRSPMEQADSLNLNDMICPPIWTPLAYSAAAQQQSMMCEHDSLQHRSCGPKTQLLFPSTDSNLDNKNDNSSPNISQTEQVLSDDQHLHSPLGSSDLKAEHQLYTSSPSIGSLSLRANTPEPSQTVSRSSSSQSLYRQAVLNSRERFYEAFMDEECALYMCRLQNYFKPSFVDRGFTNPVARILTEGDDMHFVPIWEDNLAHAAMQGSAFSCYSA